MEGTVASAVTLVQEGHPSFFKFVAANETGETGGHQCGFYLPKEFAENVLGGPCEKGRNLDALIDVVWNEKFATKSRCVYYGVGTRNEARITRFGRGFEYLQQEYVGALVVFVLEGSSTIHSFVFNSDEEIEEFLGALGLGPTDANQLINLSGMSSEKREVAAFNDFIRSLKEEFPSSEKMSAAAREIENVVYDHIEDVKRRPDEKLLKWSDVEYRLFRAIENSRFGKVVAAGFASVEEFVEMANKVLNRRKSRAGKSLEHHLSAIFAGNGLDFEEQVVTEGNKRPDFIFPSGKAYHDASFPDERLVFLAAKTTCKDRWRQILKEAERFEGKSKYLCTLQQGISLPQMQEMSHEGVVLVVPKPYISYYPISMRNQIMDIGSFVTAVKHTQAC